MPDTGQLRHPLAVRQILRHAHTLLSAAGDEESLSLEALLTRAADRLPLEDRPDLDPPTLAWAVAEAAAQLLACVRTPIRPQDPHLTYCLQALDRLPRTARIGLLTAAVRRTDPDQAGSLDGTSPLAPTRRFVPDGPAPAGRRTAGRCPCECNSEGFCGGCGHAGCGGRR
ncbi:hypothetical protein GCM10011579_097230 [Streptomyces albiflavescens]|uniref:Uncharacterized protein n=1 Tax=Streptomyces albiflavescens TaxID=1623582 RepID=A0A917YF56_9ACTN|nr:hypothetical protein [Streptomyces albiflavescens]GGN96131.1 hypothetical protein GCM10011579_097230 [Streptomyces albiflavescens]